MTVPANEQRLASFTYTASFSASLIFRPHVYAWDGSKATGESLWSGPPQSTDGSSNVLLTFTPNVAVTPGSQYVLFLAVTEDSPAGAIGQLTCMFDSSYTDGHLVWSEFATAPEWTTTSWNNDFIDLDLTTTIVFDTVETTTTLISTPNPSVFGQPTTFTATVSSSSGTPSGTVTFKDGDTVLGTGTLDVDGNASITVSSLSVGTHSIVAVYGANGVHGGSTSSPREQVVDKADTTTTVASSSNPSPAGSSVTFTATVTAIAPGVGTPGGTVTFKDGTTTLGTGTLDGSGVATFATSALAFGEHSITAEYGGDASFDASTSAALTQDVDPLAATIALTAAPNPSTFGQAVTLTVNVAGSNGTPAGTVTFKHGATTLGTGTLTDGDASIETTSLPVGVLTLTVEYGGDDIYEPGTGTTSHTVQTVNAEPDPGGIDGGDVGGGGCGCREAPAGTRGAAFVGLMGALALAVRRRRR